MGRGGSCPWQLKLFLDTEPASAFKPWPISFTRSAASSPPPVSIWRRLTEEAFGETEKPSYHWKSLTSSPQIKILRPPSKVSVSSSSSNKLEPKCPTALVMGFLQSEETVCEIIEQISFKSILFVLRCAGHILRGLPLTDSLVATRNTMARLYYATLLLLYQLLMNQFGQFSMDTCYGSD